MKYFIFLLTTVLFVQSSNAQISDSARREVKLNGAINFRDIGGYETKDGRHVKWGKIYRSAALNELTSTDIQKISDLKISIDADFRGPYEVKIAPDKIPNSTTRISLPAGSENIGDPASMKVMFAHLKDSGLASFYSNTTAFRDRYKPVFDELLEISPDSALLFHCSAGKDRTGICAALVLYVLNVPEETIMEDYLASDYYRKSITPKEVDKLVRYFGIDKQDAQAMSGVSQEYLVATYNSILRKYGSMNAFLVSVLELDDHKIMQLRNKFLE